MVGTATDRVELLNLRKERRRSATWLAIGAVMILAAALWAATARAPVPVANIKEAGQSVTPVTVPGDEVGLPTAYLVTGPQGDYLCTRNLDAVGQNTYTCSELPK